VCSLCKQERIGYIEQKRRGMRVQPRYTRAVMRVKGLQQLYAVIRRIRNRLGTGLERCTVSITHHHQRQLHRKLQVKASAIYTYIPFGSSNRRNATSFKSVSHLNYRLKLTHGHAPRPTRSTSRHSTAPIPRFLDRQNDHGTIEDRLRAWYDL
jgi:hypothetical protein